MAALNPEELIATPLENHVQADEDEVELPVDVSGLLADVRWVRRLALRLVREPAEADDLAQETWLAFARSGPPAKRAVRPWLARVLRNAVRMRRRGDRRRLAREAATARHGEHAAAADVVERAEIQHRVVAVVLALSEPHRSTLLLRYFEDLSSAAIARRKSVPASTVRRHLKEALDLVREKLDRQHGGERDRWRASLLLLAPSAAPQSASIAGGLLLVKSGTKVAVAVAVLLTVAAAIVTVRERRHRNAVSGDAAEPANETVVSASPERSEPQRERLQPPAQATAVPELVVRVIDRETHAALSVNGVGARGADGKWQRLAADATPGRYTATLVGFGPWYLRILTPGYHGWDGWASTPAAAITAELAPICRVSGRLAPGMAANGAEVFAVAATGARAAQASLASDSSFVLDDLVWGEWYTLGCSWIAGSDAAAPRFQVTSRHQDLGVIEVESRSELEILLDDESGAPVADAHGRITSYDGDAEIATCEIDFDATGVARVFLRAGAAHVLSVHTKDRSAALHTDRFTIRHPRDERRFVLSPTVAVAGVVLNEAGLPVVDAHVFIPEEGSLSAPWRAKTDANGTFAFTGLESGRTYHVYAGHSGHFQRRPTTVIAPAESVTVSLVAARGTLRVKVIDASSRQPITSGRFLITGLTGYSPDWRADESGWAMLPDLRHLDETITLDAQGYSSVQMRLADLAPDSEVTLVRHARFDATIECPLELTPFARLLLVFRAPGAQHPEHESIRLADSDLGFPRRAPTKFTVSLPWLGAGEYTVEWRDNSEDPNDHYPRAKYLMASGSSRLDVVPEQPVAISLVPSRVLLPSK